MNTGTARFRVCVSVAFGKAILEAHQRTNLYTADTINQLKATPITQDVLALYQNMVGSCTSTWYCVQSNLC